MWYTGNGQQQQQHEEKGPLGIHRITTVLIRGRDRGRGRGRGVSDAKGARERISKIDQEQAGTLIVDTLAPL